jgi:hypothetical protein
VYQESNQHQSVLLQVQFSSHGPPLAIVFFELSKNSKPCIL